MKMMWDGPYKSLTRKATKAWIPGKLLAKWQMC